MKRGVSRTSSKRPTTDSARRALQRIVACLYQPTDIIELVERVGAWLETSEIPKFFINAYPGSILTGRQRDYCRTWPNQQEQMVIGIHYIQEDSPHLIGEGIARFLQSLS